MNKIEIFLLNSTFEQLPEKWDIKEFIHFNYSNVMKSLYMTDFPQAWADVKKRPYLAAIGANDYFNKWTGKEFMEIEGSALEDIYGKVKKELANGSIVNGKKTGIPLSGGNHQILFYNRKYVSREPESFEDLISLASQAKEKYNLEYGFVFPTGACYFILPLLYGFGANLWSVTGEEGILYEPLFKVIKLLRNLIYEKEMLPIKWEQESSMPCFMGGRAAFCIGGDWNIHEFDEAIDHELGICPIPPLERECRTTANANYLFLNNELPEKMYETVKIFCKYILSDEIQMQLLEKLYRMPASINLKVDQFKFGELTAKSYEIYNKSFIMPPIVEITHMYHVLADMLEPGVLISDTPENLTNRVLYKLADSTQYYKYGGGK